MRCLFIILLVITLISGCQKDEDPTSWKNQSPLIQSLTANPDTIYVNGETTLTCIASDPDGDSLTIEWKANTGLFPIINTGKSVKWKATDSIGNYPINVFVTDGKDTKSDTMYVAVVKTPPPILKTPSNNAVDVSIPVTLEWEAVGGAIGYTLQVSTDSLFSTFIFNQSGLTNTSQEVSGLNYFTKYYWRVNATNSYGTSDWSITWKFFTIFLCGSSMDYFGKIYNTVAIGNQCWFKENLNVGTMIVSSTAADSQKNNGIIEKYCYGNNPSNCNTYGGLYQWNEVMQYNTTPGDQGICPEGWHIPTISDFNILDSIINYNSNSLKAVGEGVGVGAGTNLSGFSALLGGVRYKEGTYGELTLGARFWTSNTFSMTNAHLFNIDYDKTYNYINQTEKTVGFSVRCIKD